MRLENDNLYHSFLSRSLRFSFRECLDSIRISETLLMAKSAWNSGSTRSGAVSDVNSSLRKYACSWPYIRVTEKDPAEQEVVDENRGRALMEKFIKYREEKSK